jgi:4-hydroxybenzoate polyprenyltransferase
VKLLASFFRLIRWTNLLFIVLTQFLFYYCIIVPSLPASYYTLDVIDPLTPGIFYWLVAASVLIAAGGYIINDYFDIDIDQVNKPEKVVIDRYIKRRWTIVWHLILTTAGVAISFYVGSKTSIVVTIGNIACTLFLWVYSTTFKKKLLSGNIIIAALTAWTVLVMYFATSGLYESLLFIDRPVRIDPAIYQAVSRIYKLAVVFGGFAFIATLIREAIKDMEDIEGDKKYGCKTMPIVWGIPAAKVYTAVWVIVLGCASIIIGSYLLHLGWWLSALYSFILVAPCILLLRRLYASVHSFEYHQLSSIVKLLMLGGILFMLFLRA